MSQAIAMKKPRILVVRNDKIGDFMLAWPALALLRRSLPEAHISVLVPSYTQALAQCCPWVDQVLSDPDDLGRMHKGEFNILLTLFSTPRIGWRGCLGRIPLRLAPATKWAQLFYNRRVRQRRSQSRKPEFEYNLDLAAELIRLVGGHVADNPAPYWPMSTQQRLAQRQVLAGQLDLPMDVPWVFVHAGSGGSAVNLSVDQYAGLVRRLHQLRSEAPQAAWVLTAGPGEQVLMHELLQRLDGLGVVRAYESKQGLAAFAQSLCAADLFIAGSTGPLHIAGALDVPTIGFFPAKRSATALRWRPCNAAGRTLALSAPLSAMDEPNPMTAIDIEQAAAEIHLWWQGLEHTTDGAA